MEEPLPPRFHGFQIRRATSLTNAVQQLDCIEQGVRAGDRAVFHLVALFQAAESNRLVRQINPLGRQLQGFRNSAPRVTKVRQKVLTSARSCALAEAMNRFCSSVVRYLRFLSRVNSSPVICSHFRISELGLRVISRRTILLYYSYM